MLSPAAAAGRGSEVERELTLLVARAGNIKMDRDSAPLSSEPNYDREWKISAYENGEASGPARCVSWPAD